MVVFNWFKCAGSETLAETTHQRYRTYIWAVLRLPVWIHTVFLPPKSASFNQWNTYSAISWIRHTHAVSAPWYYTQPLIGSCDTADIETRRIGQYLYILVMHTGDRIPRLSTWQHSVGNGSSYLWLHIKSLVLQQLLKFTVFCSYHLSNTNDCVWYASWSSSTIIIIVKLRFA